MTWLTWLMFLWLIHVRIVILCARKAAGRCVKLDIFGIKISANNVLEKGAINATRAKILALSVPKTTFCMKMGASVLNVASRGFSITIS